MRKKLFVLQILVMLFSVNAFGQTTVISGHVTAFNHYPLKNVKIEAKKAKSAVKSDSLGKYQIVCSKKDKLVFTAEVFEPVYKKVNAKTETINVNMVFREGQKNEEIAVGYGYMDKEDLTYAVSQLSDENNDFANYTDIYRLIQGKFAGVSVVYETNGPKIYVRGIKSTVSDSYALILVDGITVKDVSYLNPSSVKSIEVLKDAAANIYGNRGAHGVVLITTK